MLKESAIWLLNASTIVLIALIFILMVRSEPSFTGYITTDADNEAVKETFPEQNNPTKELTNSQNQQPRLKLEKHSFSTKDEVY